MDRHEGFSDVRRTLIVASTLLFLAACTTSKTVRITSEPTEATVTLTPIMVSADQAGDASSNTSGDATDGAGDEAGIEVKSQQIISLPAESVGVTEFRRRLEFGKEGKLRYAVKVAKAEFTSAHGEIEYEADPPRRTEFHFKLKRIVTQIPLVQFLPEQRGDGVVLGMAERMTRAYLDTNESSPHVRRLQAITNIREGEVLLQHAVSPVADIMIVPVLREERSMRGEDYVVESKDSWQAIAEKFDMTVDDLRGMNPTITRQVRTGEIIRVPKLMRVANLWRYATDSSLSHRITAGNYIDLSPSFSRDGKSLFFAAGRVSINPTLWRTSPEGDGGLMRVTEESFDDFDASATGDGGLVTYTRGHERADAPEIWIVGYDGLQPKPTMLIPGQSPALSNDGQSIAFVRYDPNDKVHRIWRIKTNGTQLTQVTQNVGYDCIDPAWSPGDQHIAFASNESLDSEGQPNWDIWMMNASGGGEKVQLTMNGSWDDNPVWDRDGRILFRSNRGGNWNIWRVTPVSP